MNFRTYFILKRQIKINLEDQQAAERLKSFTNDTTFKGYTLIALSTKKKLTEMNKTSYKDIAINFH